MLKYGRNGLLVAQVKQVAKISYYTTYKLIYTTHLLARQIRTHNYSSRMPSGCQMNYVNLQGFGNAEISEGREISSLLSFFV